MASSRKEEYPPLLPAGFHPLTMREIEALCVDAFPGSETRREIMAGLKKVVAALRARKVSGAIWINGSFMTSKLDPEDADIVLHVQGEFYDHATAAQQQAIDWVGGNLKHSHHCDSYLYFEYAPEHHWYWLSEWMRAYWIRQFDFSRGADLKGMALIEL